MADSTDTPLPSTAADAPVPFFKRRGPKSTMRKKPATPPPGSSSDDDSDYDSSDEKRPIKRQKKAVVTASSKDSEVPLKTDVLQPSFVNAEKKAELSNIDEATKTSHLEDEISADRRAALARGDPEALSNTYKGSSGYTNFLPSKPPTNSSGEAPAPAIKGPLKAPPSNIRTVTVVDFAPDVCKDYKQTGFCGFGDSCKFLHAREDYAQGWQLERDWEIKKKLGGRAGGESVGHRIKTLENAHEKLWEKEGDKTKEEKEEERIIREVPFKCVICKGDYKDPIVTKCGHYFCEKCAIDRYAGRGPGKKPKKEPSCAICGGRTDGVFNRAKGLERVLEKKRAREEEMKKAEEEKKKIEEEARKIVRGGW